MNISEYIAALEAIKAKHGDLEVEGYSFNFERAAVSEPRVKYRAILKGRESKERFWDSHQDMDRRGDKVCFVG